MVPPEKREMLDLEVPLVRLVEMALMVLPVMMVHLVVMVMMVLPVWMVPMVLMVLPDPREILAQLVPREIWDFPVVMDFPDLQEIEDLQDLRDPREMLDLQESLELKEILDLRDLRESPVFPDLEEGTEPLESQDKTTLSLPWTALTRREILVMTEKRVTPVPRETLDPRDLLDLRERREKLVILDLGE